jgi:hypothetical protein
MSLCWACGFLTLTQPREWSDLYCEPSRFA